VPDTQAVDTVSMARQKFPGAPASLDALCRRFGIDNSARTLHGALLDAELLAEVYLELRGGRQPGLVLETEIVVASGATAEVERIKREPRSFTLSEAEREAHQNFVATLTDPIWNK
jgi:DNA polymerase-3 subunit epsilon